VAARWQRVHGLNKPWHPDDGRLGAMLFRPASHSQEGSSKRPWRS